MPKAVELLLKRGKFRGSATNVSGAAHGFEVAGGGDGARRAEDGDRALQGMGGAANCFSILPRNGLPDGRKFPWRVREE